MDPINQCLDPEDAPSVALHPWQVEFLAWAEAQQGGPIEEFPLADDIRLGKTISALSTLAKFEDKVDTSGSNLPTSMTPCLPQVNAFYPFLPASPPAEPVVEQTEHLDFRKPQALALTDSRRQDILNRALETGRKDARC